MKKRTLKRMIRLLEKKIRKQDKLIDQYIDEAPGPGDLAALNVASMLDRAINAHAEARWKDDKEIGFCTVYVTAFGEVPIRWEFEEKQDPVKQCPGCKMAIYDGAAERGWCLNCLPLTDAELESEHDGCAKRPVVPDKDWSRTRSVWDEKTQALRDQEGIKPCLEYEAFLPPHDLRCRNCGMHPEVHQ